MTAPTSAETAAAAEQAQPPPRVVFVCVKNGGKSQMAAGLMRQVAGHTVEVDSAGTRPGTAINALSAQALAEVGVDITDQSPKQLTDDMVAAANVVVTLGRDATVEPVAGTPVVNWDTDEPSKRGIDTAWSGCGWSATTSPPLSARLPTSSPTADRAPIGAAPHDPMASTAFPKGRAPVLAVAGSGWGPEPKGRDLGRDDHQERQFKGRIDCRLRLLRTHRQATG